MQTLFPFQKKSIKAFNFILKDETIKSIKKNGVYWEINYKNGQLFRCNGVIVDNSLIVEKEFEKKVNKKLF
jgi:hypothetical protein